jgi:hypothetical protein
MRQQTHAKLTQNDLAAIWQFCKCLKRMVARGGIEMCSYLYDLQIYFFSIGTRVPQNVPPSKDQSTTAINVGET